MSTKHLYVAEGDPEVALLWEQAGIVATREHRSLSWVVHEALRTYLAAIVIAEETRRATP